MKHSEMPDNFLNAAPSDIYIQSVGDVIEIKLSDNEKVNRDVIALVRKSITEYRVCDITEPWEEYRRVTYLDQPPLMMVPTDGFLFQKGEDRTDIPFVSEPMLGIVGWYQYKENKALVVMPFDDDETASGFRFYEVQELAEPGKFTILVGGILVCDGGADWMVGVHTAPFNSEADEKYVDKVNAGEWVDWISALVKYPIDGVVIMGAKESAYFMQMAINVLLANTFVQVDRTVFHTENTPDKLRKARERRRGHSGPRARSWLMLPGLKCDKDGHWSTEAVDGHRARHFVRGHWRVLRADRFKIPGSKVWVRPHIRGNEDDGRSNVPYKIK